MLGRRLLQAGAGELRTSTRAGAARSATRKRRMRSPFMMGVMTHPLVVRPFAGLRSGRGGSYSPNRRGEQPIGAGVSRGPPCQEDNCPAATPPPKDMIPPARLLIPVLLSRLHQAPQEPDRPGAQVGDGERSAQPCGRWKGRHVTNTLHAGRAALAVCSRFLRHLLFMPTKYQESPR